MDNKMKNRLMAASLMLLGVIGLIAGPLIPAASAASTSSPVVQVQTFGATYGEFSARWWQWALSIPTSINPVLDTTGANCAQGQYDDVWFLAGTFGGAVTRNCSIPSGKPIFFPLINNVAFKPTGSETLLDLRSLAAGLIDTVTQLTCTIDGVATNLSQHRVRSPAFTVIAPANGLIPPGWLSLPAHADAIVSDGYWLLLSPLAMGSHVIHFQATTSNGFALDVTYELSIGP
jgi:hypothetical protein